MHCLSFGAVCFIYVVAVIWLMNDKLHLITSHILYDIGEAAEPSTYTSPTIYDDKPQSRTLKLEELAPYDRSMYR